MKKDNKKALYESIMTSVAREVKKALNESADLSLTEDEIDKLDEFFTENIENYEKVLKRGTFAAYFPDRKTMKNMEQFPNIPLRVGMNNIPHITISRQQALNNGDFRVTIYKLGAWTPSEWPDKRRLFDINGNPVSENIE